MIFFRDDDVGALDRPLQTVVELLLAEGVPCNYQVIPTRLTPAAARYLRARRARRPDLVRLNQHGYRHWRYLPDGRRRGEFTGHPPYAEQYEAIARGRERLSRLLGEDLDATVFTPPCNLCDAATLRALDALGFEVLSASVRSGRRARILYGLGHALRSVELAGRRVSFHGRRLPRTRLREISCGVDVNEDFDRLGHPRVKSAGQLHDEVARVRRRHAVVGISLHHAHYADRGKLRTLQEFLDRLRGEPGATAAAIEEIAASLP